MRSRNPAFLGQVALRPERVPHAVLGQYGPFDMPPDCGYWADQMKKAAQDIADSQRSIQARANSPYRTDFVNDPYTQMKFEDARKRYDNAKRSYDSCIKWAATYWEGTPIQQPVTTPQTTTSTGGTQPQLQPPIETPPQPLEDIGPMDVPSFDPRSLLPPTETPYINPHTIETEPEQMPLPGEEQAQGLPCPEGQYRPPGAGWCVPKPVQTGYSPGNALQRFGGYGGIINMAPTAAAASFLSEASRKEEEAMVNGPFLGQIPIAPEAQCPPGKVLYNVAGSLLCVEAGQFPPAEYSGARPIGAFGGFGRAPSAPFGTTGMGPSSVPVTLGSRAMLGQVRLVRRPY